MVVTLPDDRFDVLPVRELITEDQLGFDSD